jgi:hypothetical protein
MSKPKAYLLDETGKKIIDNLRSTGADNMAPSQGVNTNKNQVQLLKITSIVSESAAPYKYHASILSQEFTATGQAGKVLATDVDLWLADKADLTTEDGKLYDAVYEYNGQHWRGLKKKDFQ